MLQSQTIGKLAAEAGVSVETIRYYQRRRLFPVPKRLNGSARRYGKTEAERLRFIKRARLLGFPLKRIEQLLGLWNDRQRASAEVKALAEAHAAELGARIAEMQAMQRSLQALARDCQGDSRPECPILDDLAGPGR